MGGRLLLSPSAAAAAGPMGAMTVKDLLVISQYEEEEEEEAKEKAKVDEERQSEDEETKGVARERRQGDSKRMRILVELPPTVLEVLPNKEDIFSQLMVETVNSKETVSVAVQGDIKVSVSTAVGALTITMPLDMTQSIQGK